MSEREQPKKNTPQAAAPGRSKFDDELDRIEEADKPLWAEMEKDLDRIEEEDRKMWEQ